MIRVGMISPEPTPYRAPLFDRISREPDVDLTVIYAAATVAGREWTVEPRHRAIVLAGRSLPLVRRLLHHDYPLSVGVWRELRRGRFNVLVVAGWSTFASQAAIAWARLHRVPYIITSESHLLDPRPAWVRAIKRLVLPRIVRPAAGYLVTGTLSARCIATYGGREERIGRMANTVDVDALTLQAEDLRRRREELRTSLGIAPGEVALMHCGHIDVLKGVDVLVDAAARARATGPPLRLLLVGRGAFQSEAARRCRAAGLPVSMPGFLSGADLLSAYVAADVFVLLSLTETWGVVVNEAMAAGLPVVLSDRVGAAADLLVSGENGELVPVGDVATTAAAIARIAEDDALRAHYGARSREIVASWGYEPSITAFVEAVRTAVSARAED